MKLKVLLAVILFFPGLNLWSQQDTIKPKKIEWDYEYKNVGKISVIALALSNLSLSYERSFKPRWTAGLYAGYKFSGGTPTLFGLDSTSISMSTDGIKGFSFTPELRYYLKSCENQSPNGFYAGLYFRYTNYKTGARFNYYPNFPDKSEVNHIGSDISMNEVGVGVMLGYQLLIKDRFIVDFIIIGPRKSWVNMKYEFDNDVPEEFLTELEKNLQSIVDRFGFDHEVDIDKSGIKDAKFSFNFANVRFAISVGYAF